MTADADVVIGGEQQEADGAFDNTEYVLARIGNNNSFPEFTRSVSLPFEDILTMVRGNHILKFGGGYTRHRFNGHTSVAPRGQYSFSGALPGR